MGPPRSEATRAKSWSEQLGEITSEERLLVELRNWLYDRQWSTMLADLTARLTGQPYLYEWTADLPDETTRLSRIVADIARIARLAQLEKEAGRDLTELLNLKDGDTANAGFWPSPDSQQDQAITIDAEEGDRPDD